MSDEFGKLCVDDPFDVRHRATRPPMGWNSWDVFGTSVTEAEVQAAADYMSEHLKPFGYEYIVLDLGWYAPESTAVGHQYKRARPHQLIDEWGRLVPAPNRFPRCAGGFKPLADYVHERGLKFGIHVMRGIPNQAVEKNTPIRGTRWRAQDIARRWDRCVFYDGMSSLQTAHPGTLAYYASVLELYAQWGVDFIKADDMSRYPRAQHMEEFILFRRALESCGRDIVLSMSPGGGTSVMDRGVVTHFADMFRISGDLWDQWEDVKNMFGRCQVWNPYRVEYNWPDCDMLPVGVINIRGENGDGVRHSRLTLDEQQTMMTLWCIFRSPLMLGCDLTQLDESTRQLISNPRVLAVNQEGQRPTQLLDAQGIVAWESHDPTGQVRYLAVFNTTDSAVHMDLHATQLVDLERIVDVTDLWSGRSIGARDLQAVEIRPHAALFVSLRSDAS